MAHLSLNNQKIIFSLGFTILQLTCPPKQKPRNTAADVGQDGFTELELSIAAWCMFSLTEID